MIVVDRLFKDVYYESIDDLILVEIVKVYYINIWKHIDFFNIIVSDRGTQFVNNFWNEFCKWLNITVFLFTAYHSQIDDQIKIVNAIMKQYFRIYCVYLQNNWVKWLFFVNFVVRNHYSKSTQCISFFANHDYHSRMKLKFHQDFAEFSRSKRERRQRIHVDEYVEKMNQINEELQAQMI